MSQHSYHLMARHQRIDAAIRHERGRAWPDLIRLLRLKTLKLALKTRMARLSLRPA